jgi:predicted DNA-binding protein
MTKKRVTIALPIELLDRLKNAVFWTPGLTLAGLVQGAIAETIERMEKSHGDFFPVRTKELKGGRPRRQRSESYFADLAHQQLGGRPNKNTPPHSIGLPAGQPPEV